MSDEIRFADDERALIADKVFFEKKRAVSEKIRSVFSQVRDGLARHMKPDRYLAPEGVDFTKGKLSGGEHHYDLPYIFLDFPRRFSRTDIFAYRSLFWWGHHFLLTLILAGDLLPEFRRRAFSGWDRLAERGDWIAVTPDPWEWRMGEEHARRVRTGETEALERTVSGLPLLKLIRFIPFDDPRVEEGLLARAGLETFRDWEFIISR
ncbi:MAG: hypothetical protein ACE5IM_00020 [Nitrospinota bacterium]